MANGSGFVQDVSLKSYVERFNSSVLVRRLLIALIVLYPTVGIFFGLDLGDTGFHLYSYTHFFDDPQNINYPVYLSSLVGALWNEVFGFMGLLGFNILEVLMELAMVLLVYKTSSGILGKNMTLLGSLIAIMAADCYLNIFNYHQFTVFLILCILLLQISAIMKDSVALSLCSGLVFTAAVFAKLSCLAAIVTLTLYLVDYAYHKGRTRLKLHLFSWFAGAALGVLLCVVILMATGMASTYLHEALRIGDIAQNSTTSYNLKTMITSLVKENLRSALSAMIYIAAFVVSVFSFSLIEKPSQNVGVRVVRVIFGGLFFSFALYQLVHSMKLYAVPDWPQMTSGQQYTIGIMYLFSFFVFVGTLANKKESNRHLRLFSMAAFFLVLLPLAGGNTGTKHVVICMWLIAPLFVYATARFLSSELLVDVLDRLLNGMGLKLTARAFALSSLLLMAMFGYKFGNMIYHTFNYDDIHRWYLTSTVDNPHVRGILTTSREAATLEGTTRAIKESGGDSLMVFGATTMLYYLSDMPSYAKPWFTSATFSNERLERAMEHGKEKFKDKLPTVVYCRTNYSWGFQATRLARNQALERAMGYSGKKKWLIEYLAQHHYRISYIDDYHVVFVPDPVGEPDNIRKVITYNKYLYEINTPAEQKQSK